MGQFKKAVGLEESKFSPPGLNQVENYSDPKLRVKRTEDLAIAQWWNAYLVFKACYVRSISFIMSYPGTVAQARNPNSQKAKQKNYKFEARHGLLGEILPQNQRGGGIYSYNNLQGIWFSP